MKAFSQNKNIGLKILIIFILGLLMLIPMLFIEDIIYDRQSYQKKAVRSIIEPLGGELYVDGIYIFIPYTRRYTVSNENGETKQQYVQDYYAIVASDVNVHVNADLSMLERGIFKAPVFNADIQIKGQFVATDAPFHGADMENAILLIPTQNKQNYKSMPTITVDGVLLKAVDSNNLPRSSKNIFKQGFAYQLHTDKAALSEMIRQGFHFSAHLNVQGGTALHIMPNFGDTKVDISSNWADPSFVGKWLPNSRKVNDEGFQARWEIPSFNSPLGTRVFSLSEHDDTNSYITTQFLLLSDNYVQSMKSIKYAILFIFVPFFALLLCEIIAKKEVHFIQYILIGLANAIFYMLLLSMSEYLSFNVSYLIGASMVVILTGMYAYSILRSKKLGTGIALIELLSYAFLFALLQLTNYALLIGSLGMFGAIAVAMYCTRNINSSTHAA